MATKTVYGASAAEIAELFVDYIEGDASRPAIALSSSALEEVARDAIEKSLGAFGYASPSCTYVIMEANGIMLDPQAVFLLIEGLDPLFVVATDKPAAEVLARAYRAAFDLDAPARLAGRPAAIFKNLSALLATGEGKQSAWRVFKTLKA